MAIITVDNLQSKTIHCNDKREKMLDVLLTEIDWMHACGGKGRCTTCKAQILEGNEHLTALTEVEEKYLKLKKLQKDERLTCQVRLRGDVKISAPQEHQLPHLNYSN